MKSLKKYLENDLTNKIIFHKDSVTNTENDLDELMNETNTNNALYNVYLRALWADHGEKHISVEYRGTLKKAIKHAEEEFLKQNVRSDNRVQADYLVKIALGNDSYIVPEPYWSKFIQRNNE